MTITMECKTFENATIAPIWWYGFLMFAMSMLVEARPNDGAPRDRLLLAIGAERYVRLKEMFKRREL